MKRNRLLKLFSKNGWYLYRHGGNHDIWTNGKLKEQIPRHPDINERLAKGLIKKHGLK
ncbi:type II toxin-antitoxin system HicA family toxin [Levilactobacillus brevis]|uniref:type II toxin-antitoxin system HicA family toxin n=1 Tax=Levilactobacillus brevis TaxID=1580 RepID=UPI00096B99A9|nr:type II toxin-antitoxin system HicA family toxin [Levilactobacillus brevis]ATU69493.1 type II toxin-antitoxin system HicA family toxin [Levilactobacillus brevis]